MQVRILPTFLVTVIVSTSSLLASKSAFAAASNNQYQASKYRELGLSYQRQERYPEAIASMKKSVELEPNNFNGRVNLGWTQHLAGQEDSAAESLWQAASLNPFSPPTFNALGIVYLVSGDLTTAVIVHTWAALLKPKNEIAFYNLSLAYHRLKLYDSAVSNATKAATLEQSNPHPLVALAIAYWDSDDRIRAQLAYRKALDLDARYSDRNFLTYLKEAGFSPEQITTSQQILAASKS
jgi:Flp pilus assembly protein TadD